MKTSILPRDMATLGFPRRAGLPSLQAREIVFVYGLLDPLSMESGGREGHHSRRRHVLIAHFEAYPR